MIFSCVIKLHGDVAEMLTYEDAKSEVFTQKQYVNSLKSNESLLKNYIMIAYIKI